MAMVVALHFNGVALDMWQPVANCNFADVAGMEILEACSIIGVNLFVLISGYFGIRLSAKGIAKYVGWVLWYSILLFLLRCCFHPDYFTPRYARLAFLGITHSTQWFVTGYFILMALSPAVNAVLRRTTFRQHLALAAALIAVNCVGGWWLEMDFNKTGYTVYHLVFVYILGHMMRESMAQWSRLPWRWAGIAVYAASVAALVWMMQWTDYGKAMAYNNPIVVLESLALFSVFATMHFTSRAVNWIASSAFAVYLIHMHFSVYPYVLRPMLLHIYHTFGSIGASLLATALGMVVFALCILIDKPRTMLFNRLLSLRGKRKGND